MVNRCENCGKLFGFVRITIYIYIYICIYIYRGGFK